MEDYSEHQPQSEGNINQDVSFPSVKPKKKNKKLTYIIIAIIGVMILGGGGFFLLSSPKFDEDANPSPTPFIEPIQRGDDVLPSETEAPSEPKEIDRASIKIEIQNGTGVPKEASFLQNKLEELGYEDIKTGNASDQSGTTTKVTFSADLQKEAVDEITKELKGIYEKVTSDTSKSQDVDVLIITGKRSGVTNPPKATAAPKATTAPTSSPKASSSPSASPTSTP